MLAMAVPATLSSAVTTDRSDTTHKLPYPVQRVVRLDATVGATHGFPEKPPERSDEPGYVVVSPVEGGLPHKLVVAADYKRKLGSLDSMCGQWVMLTFGTVVGKDIVALVTRYDGSRLQKRPSVYTFEGLSQLAQGRARLATLLDFPADSRADDRSLEAMGRWLMRFSPGVCAHPPSSFFLGVTSLLLAQPK